MRRTKLHDVSFYFDEFKILCRHIIGREPEITLHGRFGLVQVQFGDEPFTRYSVDEFIRMYQRFKNIVHHYKPVTYSTAPGPVGQDRSRPV